jgi:membrane protease YdiL (CAAX protease family)
MKYRNRSSLSAIGFQLKGRYKEIAGNFFLGLVIIGSGTIGLIFARQITLTPSCFHWRYFAITPIIMLIIAIIEEILARGYILRTLMQSCNPYIALCVSSGLFTFLHIPNIIYGNYSCLPLISIFCAGILLGLIYMQTQNIWVPVALHFSLNFFQGFIFGFNVSGEEFYSILQQKRTESNFWNGGDFGFEGSVLCILIIVIVCIAFLFQKNASVKHR